jgi:peptidoglycan/LPS O-acetylase OafA/YrhL
LQATNHYRPDIDGLRAIAVVLVVLYHYKLAPIPGGFVGVDVFFVISGYLITGILRREITAGSFSLWRFYERRFRRIAPSLLVVLGATLVAGWFVLLPPDYEALGRQSTAAMAGASNIFFWDTAGYFERSAAMQPLLHTWSLGVEEQFYLVWPIVFVVAARLASLHRQTGVLATSIVVVVALSLAATTVVMKFDPSAAFYLPMFRAWELALGGLLTFLPSLKSRLGSHIVPLLGLGSIAVSSLAITEFDPFPGILALAPCLGAALVIWNREPGTVGERILSAPPLVWVGKLSYSLYLWHWPVLVMYRHEHLGAYPDKVTATILVAVCFALAALTYGLIETPFRDQVRMPRRRLLSVGISACGAILIASVTIIATDGVPYRIPVDITFDGADLQSPQRERCHQTRLDKLPPKQECLLGDTSVAPDTVVWGDSHGVELAGALGDLYAQNGRSLVQITLSACPPALNYISSRRPLCASDNGKILQYLKQSTGVKTVVLASRHLYHRDGRGELYDQSFTETVRALTESGKHVVVVGPTPAYEEPIPLVVARMKWRGRTTDVTIPTEEWQRARRDLDPLFQSLAQFRGVQIIEPDKIFCDELVCRFVQNGKAMLFDSNHPSVLAAAEAALMVYPATVQSDASSP